MAYIYKIANTVNQKVYIGTTKYNPQQRWKEHLSRYKQLLHEGDLKYPIYFAFDKYGVENFYIETIEECDESQMFDMERYYIQLYNAYGAGGYNATVGGEGYSRLTEADKQEIIDTYLQCNTIAETHKKTGRNQETIHNVLCEYHINTTRQIDAHTIEEIIDLFKNGVSTTDIANICNCCVDTVLHKLNNAGLFTYKQLWLNGEIDVDEQYICDLYDNGLTISEIVHYVKSMYPYICAETITKILNNHGYCTSKSLENNLCLEEVMLYYKQTKSIKQTAEHFNVTRRALSRYLFDHNIEISSINLPIGVVLHKNKLCIGFTTLIDCAKFVQQHYLPNNKNLRGIRDNISKALKNKTSYAGIKFYERDIKNMVKICVNSDKELVTELRAKIKANNGHCACSIIPTNDNKCMCKEFREQVERNEAGKCHCGLYEVVITKD